MMRAALAVLFATMLSGCVVLTVASTAVSVGATVVGAAVDVAVGAVKLTGKAIGAVVDAASGSSAKPESAAAEKPASK
jgi:hypothetical protein